MEALKNRPYLESINEDDFNLCMSVNTEWEMSDGIGWQYEILNHVFYDKYYEMTYKQLFDDMDICRQSDTIRDSDDMFVKYVKDYVREDVVKDATDEFVVIDDE